MEVLRSRRSSLDSSAHPLAADLRERYALDRELGRGGMAVVYLGRDLRHDRSVAVKVLHPELASVLGPERFVREIRLAARLDHPNILPLLDSGESEGKLWYAMPYVNGGSVRQRLQREVQLGIEEAVRIARDVAAARRAYEQFLARYDMPPPSHRHLVTEARTALARLGAAPNHPGER